MQAHLTLLETEKFTQAPSFASKDVYDQSQNQLSLSFIKGDLEKIREIVSSIDVRRVPFSRGWNSQLSGEEFQSWTENAGQFFWSGLIQMLYSRAVPEERMIEVIQYVLTSGNFNIRQALIQTNHQGWNDETCPRVPNVLGIALLVSQALRLDNVFRYLWSVDFINIWGPKHFQLLLDIFIRDRNISLLTHLLQSPVGVN